MSNTSNGGSFVDKIKGKAKQVAGAVTGDELLTQEGKLHEAKADATERAEHLDAEAEAERERAELTAREKELQVERQQLAAEEASEAREARLEQERRAEEARLEREHAAKETAVERQAQAQQQAVARDEVAAAKERGTDLRDADRIDQEAAAARAAAEALEAAAKTES